MGPAGSVGLTGQSGLACALWTNETLSNRKWTTPLRMTHKVVPPTFANIHTCYCSTHTHRFPQEHTYAHNTYICNCKDMLRKISIFLWIQSHRSIVRYYLGSIGFLESYLKFLFLGYGWSEIVEHLPNMHKVLGVLSISTEKQRKTLFLGFICMTVACMSSKLMRINKYKEPRTWLRCNSTTLLSFIFTINITEEQPFFLQINMNTKYVMSLRARE